MAGAAHRPEVTAAAVTHATAVVRSVEFAELGFHRLVEAGAE
jgi:hypothetical protein